MPIVAYSNYPSLDDIANLVRSVVNDDKAGSTNTAGEGQILTNSSVTLQNFMNSAIRETYRGIRIMGQPTLIKDNYVITGLPPVNSSLGVGVMNPAVQTSLQFGGFYDGMLMNSTYTLPSDLLMPLEMWERQSATETEFIRMHQVESSLVPRNQYLTLCDWEWRTDGIWMNGSTTTTDVRIRYICTFASLAGSTVDWTQTFVPIMDCQEAVADKISVRYSARLGGGSLQYAMQKAKESIFHLRQQITRDRQKIDYQRPIYGSNAGQAGDPASMLY